MSVTARVRRWVHRDCQHAFGQVDAARATSEAARYDAEVELAAARELNEALEAELARVRARVDRAQEVVTSPLPLTQPSLQNQGPVDAALLNVVLIRILVRNEANRDANSFYGEHLHQIADALQSRIVAAAAALRTDPERVLEDLQDPLFRIALDPTPTVKEPREH